MRLSHLLVGGVVAAAAVAGSSAFTANNPFTDTTSFAGYGAVGATGATVTGVDYVPDGTDARLLDKIVFTASNDVSSSTATLTLSDGVSLFGSYACEPIVFTTSSMIECVVTDTPRFDAFDNVALTVAD